MSKAARKHTPAVTARAAPEARRTQLLEQLATSAAPRGFRIARDLLGNAAEAEDAVQEALARACEQCERIREPGAMEAWFYRVLTNLCMRALRRRRLHQRFLGRFLGRKSSGRRADDGSNEPGGEPGGESVGEQGGVLPSRWRADRQLAHSQHVAELLRALDTLPDKQRATLLLRYGHDLSVAEVADMLGVGPATVKTHLVRGLRRLRKTMESIS